MGGPAGTGPFKNFSECGEPSLQAECGERVPGIGASRACRRDAPRRVRFVEPSREASVRMGAFSDRRKPAPRNDVDRADEGPPTDVDHEKAVSALGLADPKERQGRAFS